MTMENPTRLIRSMSIFLMYTYYFIKYLKFYDSTCHQSNDLHDIQAKYLLQDKIEITINNFRLNLHIHK